MTEKIVIFGAGQAGIAAYQLFTCHQQQQVVAFFDNDNDKEGTLLFGIPILSVNEIKIIKFDVIYIASEYVEQIEKQLIEELGITKNKIKILPAYGIKNFKLGEDEDMAELSDSILMIICNALKENNVPYHVHAGTLLGIIRDQQLIPWDDDLDIAIESKYIESCYQAINLTLPMLKEMTGEEYCIQRLYSGQSFGAVKYGDIRSFKLAPSSNINRLPLLDVFIKYQKGIFIDYVMASRGFSMPVEHVGSLKWHTYKGYQVSIPENVELYLEWYYGGDWRTPVKEWNVSMLKNITLFGVSR